MHALNYSDEKKVVLAKELVKYINQSFHNVLADSDWMNQKTKVQAFKKLQNMGHQIGYPKEVFDEKTVDQYYENVNISDDDYLKNQLNIQKDSYVHDGTYFRDPVNNDFIPSTVVPNAFYYPNLNSIEIPYGVLSRPIFEDQSPMYLNFGALGYTIGHEITHGFDDSGRARDYQGNK